ncbi:fucose 4-O-acetylase [Grimontia hollisae]|uniref:Fucose 4-O-acetylase n=1 Tax=Grimontia hollisae CIP 101886 TaxID=675812 RepID=D0I967_GRIHO|nr:acyltransferase family protein [Grimontia hollisae]AMG29445.1 fucose 4-O-acetylase [Grimontia hollisae]EEY71982.1 fucose 4-O-acetylase [Grimontia hollisae CIP 101886]MDF2184612.1 acyltransferase family protein [Grimontia hollisae]STO77475.1 Serine/alanine racemase [Grimontia hollisae]
MSAARIPSLEMGRLFAIVAVIIIHVAPLRGDAYSEGINILSDVINQVCRFAVPFFFVLTGYFVQPKLLENPTKTFFHYAKPLMTIWFVWSLIYLAMPFRFDIAMTEGYLTERSGYWDYLLEAPLNSLFEGGLVHLWYIPGLLSALGILALLIKYNQQGLMMPLALGLYVWGLGAGSYQPIMEGEAPIFTRNGPFFSLLMVTTGFELRRRNIKFSNRAAWGMLLGGMAFCLAEGVNLAQFGVWMASHDFLLGTPVMALGFFALLLNHPHWGDSPVTFALSKRVLGIYVAHFVPLILLFNLFGALLIEGPIKEFLMTPLTVLLSFGLVLLLEKIPFTRPIVQMTRKKQTGHSTASTAG